MNSLYDLINNELAWLKKNGYTQYDSLDLFITSDERSAEFISSLTGSFKFETPAEDSQLYQIARGRARHSAITFLTGLVFREFAGLFNKIDDILKKDNTAFKLWLMTSLNHDRGYTSEYITQGDLDYKTKFKYYLLSGKCEGVEALEGYDDKYPESLAYTYQEIKQYDKYARTYHKKDSDGRRLDHGILGGIILFHTLIQKYLKSKSSQQNNIEPLVIKTSALTIAQHNIFKSCDPKCDKAYLQHHLERLVSDSDFVIESSHTLLLLLSLVDTIECVKKYSKQENGDKYLQSITVLKNIMVDVSADELVVDYSKLAERELKITKKNEICGRIVANVYDLRKWTCFDVSEQGYKMTVVLNRAVQERNVESMSETCYSTV